MKGIILAAGKGTRLYPTTIGVNKHLLPVFDKPMVYYPLASLMLSGIREILIICSPVDLPVFSRLLGDGKQWGIQFTYAEQTAPCGLADAFIIGKEFIGSDTVCMILGDNIFHGTGLSALLQRAARLTKGALLFAYQVKDPERYGIVELDESNQAISIEEKPQTPRSNYAVPGIYFYDNDVIDIATKIRPSQRNELEISEVNKCYLSKGLLRVEVLGRGITWLDAGTHESLLQAAAFVQAVQERQGLMIASPDEIAFRMGWISRNQLLILANNMGNNQYSNYLQRISGDKGYS